MVKKILLFAFLALLIPATSMGEFQDQKLNAVASIFAQRPVVARCMEPDEQDSPDSLGAWGYVRVPAGKQTKEQLDADLCRAAQTLNDPSVSPYLRAMSVLVLVHESYHLRRWGGSGSEAKVECRAIRHWGVGARLLGATEETVAALWPYALAAHYEETNLVSWTTGEHPYRDDSCDVPSLVNQ